MIIAIDVHYRENVAKSVSIAFDNWTDTIPHTTHIVAVHHIAPYIPGQFYKRELPCILKVLEKSDLSKIALIIVDGYVVLNDEGKAGLGHYVYEALERKIPIVGVAKKSFHDNQKNVTQVFRGKSKNPLYVTSIGIDLEKAADYVKNMAGDYRFPELLKILDQETKR